MPNFIRELIDTGLGEGLEMPNFIRELIDTGLGEGLEMPNFIRELMDTGLGEGLELPNFIIELIDTAWFRCCSGFIRPWPDLVLINWLLVNAILMPFRCYRYCMGSCCI